MTAISTVKNTDTTKPESPKTRYTLSLSRLDQKTVLTALAILAVAQFPSANGGIVVEGLCLGAVWTTAFFVPAFIPFLNPSIMACTAVGFLPTP